MTHNFPKNMQAKKKSDKFLYLNEKSSAMYKRNLVSKALPLSPLKVKTQRVVCGMSGC